MTADHAAFFEDWRREGSTTSDWFTSLTAAQETPDAILVIEGLEHTYVLLTCPAPLTRAREVTIALLAADLHAVSFLLDGLAEHELSLWLERHVGSRRVHCRAAGNARVAHGPWLMNPWGWNRCTSAPSPALRQEVDEVLLAGKPRVAARVLREERAARLDAVRAARLAERSARNRQFYAERGWDYDVSEPQVGFDLQPADAEEVLVRQWLTSRS